MTPVPRSTGWRVLYALLLLALITLAAVFLRWSMAFTGEFTRPPAFDVARSGFYLQLGLLAGVALAAVGLFVERLRNPLLQSSLFLPAVAWAGWLVGWGFVHAQFGIRLSLGEVWALLTEPSTIASVGLTPARLYGMSGAILVALSAVAAALAFTAIRSGARFRRQAFLALLLLFLSVHLAVRGYFAYHIARGQRAILALDEATPVALRSETLIPGRADRRVTIPNLADPARTQAYLSWAAKLPDFPIRRRWSILWISIESFRADAISQDTTPYLAGHREEFQLRLDQDHWSGGNATKAGTFAMLSGLAAYHLRDFKIEQFHFPLLQLLAANGYRVRIGKSRSLDYGHLQTFFPPAAILAEIRAASLPESDRKMVDALLADFETRQEPTPSFDFLTFDATHWPYADPATLDSLAPGGKPPSVYQTIRSREDVRLARVRYRNRTRFVDQEIGRVLEYLRTSGRLQHTIVIVTGDHGEEFLERGQLAHSSGMNDFQGRVPLWIHFPGSTVHPPAHAGLTTNLDIVPTLLDFLGFQGDVLRTQGESLLRPAPARALVMLAEQGWYEPLYGALVSETYLSRWRLDRARFRFAGVERRDGRPVVGDAWWREVQAGRPAAALGYEVLPDVAEPPKPFGAAVDHW